MSKIIFPLHGFKVHVPNLLEETIMKGLTPMERGALHVPLNVFIKYIRSVAKRCTELHDPVLDRLMCEMSLYEEADPTSKDYDPKMVNKVIQRHIDFVTNG